ncbi:hypothetical protein PUNSTDRAFT_115294 [Punctularia strigosozonata HHB-11173 SS5]|uniref:uncharacterized protein n=1 Tax=Punctularia strigosozonata (strain HHB-11173) TaxID=741275 RepID=UPI0004416B19|nr:uncharacterized protein PUNSTDRAFT_115294 [Punctularia strigosozonata HHB-11173 SS5]EIN06785.1 hypothetical protein PUNSTDRAFT_115294 [Punctularia strigosozonata HHB-11173 SS5]
MNSYPPELLVQLAPVMFAAGLDPPPTTTPQSPSPTKTPDAFAILSSRLRDALLSQRKVAIWQSEKAKTFQVVLVDKDVRFPPRKVLPPEDHPTSAAHSPLSPLTPSSPLYPDGLIAPIWIRKHTTLVPSVFVLFTRLFELPPHIPQSPLEGVDPDRAREREQEERRRDAELSADIAQRKKTTNERGIKLTVVLIASRRMLDDASLDARLTFIRRSSGLDSRAALFVLSPVSAAELTDFVRSLQEALYEPALEYYTTHSKRVRRKRNRHAQGTSTYPIPMTPGSAQAKPLRPEGWTVRYEYKMACFAEFRGEDEVALKHYQDAYSMLAIMFGSPAILPPRTKRWAEAKVLVDCINIKICKLYLYNNEHALALQHYNSHVRKFGDFSRGWGIGEDTFEYWSWTARQYRVLAELLEQGIRSTLRIPTHVPAPAPSMTAVAVQQMQAQRGLVESDSLQSLGLNPSHALQHPGFYYYMAARCTEHRRERFLAAEEEEATSNKPSTAPGFANEKKVDHLTIILELYTRAYELFKKYSPSVGTGQGRQTLLIAYRIAQTYYESGKFDMAVRFFERIAKTYRRERWNSMLAPLLVTWYKCAQQLGDVELTVRLLVEMLANGAKMDDDDEASVQDDLLAVLRSTVPSSSDEPLIVDLSESSPLLDASVVFWQGEVKVGEEAAFQLSIRARDDVDVGELPFTSLAIYFSDDHDAVPLLLRHRATIPNDGDEKMVSLLGLGQCSPASLEQREVDANLRWRPGKTIIFAGTMVPEAPSVLRITRLVYTLKESAWCIEIPHDFTSTVSATGESGQWLSSLNPVRYISIVRGDYFNTVYAYLSYVRHRPHQLQLSVTHSAPAYVDEEYPILVDITNFDDRDFEVELNVLLQPTDIDGAVNYISIDDEKSSGLIKGIPLGVLKPGVSVLKKLFLVSTGGAGPRTLDISVQSRLYLAPIDSASPVSPVSPTTADFAKAKEETTETLETLLVPTVASLAVEFGTTYRRSLEPSEGVSDLGAFESGTWDPVSGGEAYVEAIVRCVGPWSLQVEGVSLVREDGDQAKILDSSLDDGVDDWLSEWQTGDEFCDICRISISPDDEAGLDDTAIQGPGRYEIKWRRYARLIFATVSPDGERGPLSTSIFRLPSLKPPIDGLIALLHVPPMAKLHTPTTVRLTVRNRHPSRAANCVVQVDTDPSDAFVLSGLRGGRLPILLPGGEETVEWAMVPLECGFVRVPRIRVVDRRKAHTPEGEVETMGENVPVVDVRWDQRDAEGKGVMKDAEEDDSDSEASDDGGGGARMGTVLVLP